MKDDLNIWMDVVAKHKNRIHNSVLEIGSRDGYDAISIAEYANIKMMDVHIVEANNILYKDIQNKFNQCNVYNFAAYNKNGTIQFNQVTNPDEVGVSSVLSRYDDYYKTIPSSLVPTETKTISSFFQENNIKKIGYCKIDVEGAAFEVLSGFEDKLNFVDTFHLEHEHTKIWKDQYLYDDIKLFMETGGFTQLHFNFTGHGNIQSDSIWINNNIF
jgi:FkbM family methyltransferase